MRRSFFLATLALISLSCTDDDTTLVAPINQSPITIATSIPFTRGSLVSNESSMGSMGVYCAKTGVEPWSATANFSKLYNSQYIYSATEWIAALGEEMWEYDTLSDKYTFFAYSPFASSTSGITPNIVEGELYIEFEMPSAFTAQPDLMIAEPRKDISPQIVNGVSLKFEHALAAICFSKSSAITDEILQISIGDVISKGVVSWDYELPSLHWDTSEQSKTTFKNQINYTDNPDGTTLLTDENNYIMMIPQVLDEDVEVILTVRGSKNRTFYIPEGTVWECGNIYSYLLDEEKDYVEVIYDSTQISNCYIVNPSESKSTIIQIPVQDRINYFWETYDSTTKIDAKTEISELCVEMLWEDFESCENDDYLFEVVRDSDDKIAVRVTLAAGVPDGNLVFTVSDSNDILWSWHLWITDYNPDAIVAENSNSITSNANKVYTASGETGAVHRYMDYDGCSSDKAVWSGIYANKFIMDRAIGSRSDAEEESEREAGIIYYQFGRKDPFPIGVVNYANGATSLIVEQNRDGGSFVDAVTSPGVLFYSGGGRENFNWCTENDAYRTDILWYDRTVTASGYSTGKSIFDPSPLGWRVPIDGTWNYIDNLERITRADDDCQAVSTFQAYGYLTSSFSSAEVYYFGDYAYLWSATPTMGNNSRSGYCLRFSSTNIDGSHSDYMGEGMSIRAVLE